MPRPTPTQATSRSRWVRALLLGPVLAAGLGAVPAGASDLEAARQRRAELQAERARLASELDVLTADKAQVVAALDALQAHAVAEQAALVEANKAAAAAFEAAGEARVAESRIEVELGERRSELRELAVAAYIGDPGVAGDLTAIVRASDVGTAAKAVYLVDREVERRDAIAEDLTALEAEREDAKEATAAASSHAAAVREEVATRVAAVEEARDRQAAFVAAAEAQLERRLAEAAGLEALDQQLATEILEGERALAERLAAEAAARDAEASARAALDGDMGDDMGDAAPPSGRVVSVSGIQVDASVAENLAALLAAASADGVRLGGGGFRDRAAQIARRLDNCGPTDHDLYVKPASQCRPPTARPGHSMHEQGLAVDFTYEGALIGSRSNPGYLWLDVNAGRFGFKNLPSEPWHWSTNGR